MGVPDHHFNPKLARDYGVDVAVFLHNIYHWLKYNKAYQKNFYEGRYWTFNSLSAFCEAHCYWSRRQIERIVSSCKSEGLLLTGNFNKDRRDRTAWYTLSDKALCYFSDAAPDVAECMSPNGEMQITEAEHSCHDSVTTIPDNNPDNSQTYTPHSPPTGDGPPKKSSRRPARTEPVYRPDWFVRFWALYPRRTARAAAVRAWDKLRPDLDLCRVMTAAIKAQMQTPQWREGPDHIPHPATWLNGARWLDEVALAPSPESTGWAPDPEVY